MAFIPRNINTMHVRNPYSPMCNLLLTRKDNSTKISVHFIDLSTFKQMYKCTSCLPDDDKWTSCLPDDDKATSCLPDDDKATSCFTDDDRIH